MRDRERAGKEREREKSEREQRVRFRESAREREAAEAAARGVYTRERLLRLHVVVYTRERLRGLHVVVWCSHLYPHLLREVDTPYYYMSTVLVLLHMCLILLYLCVLIQHTPAPRATIYVSHTGISVCSAAAHARSAPALLTRALWLTRILSVAVLVNSFWLIRFVLHIHSQVRKKKGQEEFKNSKKKGRERGKKKTYIKHIKNLIKTEFKKSN